MLLLPFSLWVTVKYDQNISINVIIKFTKDITEASVIVREESWRSKQRGGRDENILPRLLCSASVDVNCHETIHQVACLHVSLTDKHRYTTILVGRMLTQQY